MKPLPLLLALVGAPLFGADAPLPEFNSRAIGHPPLSLSEAGKPSARPPSFTDALPTIDEITRDGFRGTEKRATMPRASAPRFTQKSAPGSMPILEPNPDIDHKIVVKTPDPSVDFKMLIKPSSAERPPAR